MNDDEKLLSLDDAYAIGNQVVEMADRVRKMQVISPGATAAWGLDLDGHRYVVSIEIDTSAILEPATSEAPKADSPPLGRVDAHGNPIPWAKEHDYFMGFDPENPDIPTD